MPKPLTKVLETLEDGFVFRVARGIPLVAASLGIAVLAVSLIIFLVSLIQPMRPKVQEAPPQPPPVEINVSDIMAYMAEEKGAGEASNVGSAESGRVGSERKGVETEANEAAVAVARALHRVRGVAAKHGVMWLDETERYCASQRIFGSGCIRYATRVAKPGLESLLLEHLERFDAGSRTQSVSVPGTQVRYTINYTNHDEKARIINELVGILEAAPAGRGEEIAFAWIELRDRRESERRAQFAAARRQVAQANQAAQRAYEERLERMERRRERGVQGMAVALTIIFLTGLILAVLAIERNTRALRMHAILLQQGGRQASSSTVPD